MQEQDRITLPLVDVVHFGADSDDPRSGGCLVVNTFFEIDEPADDIAREIALYSDLFRSTFQHALATDTIPDAETRADFLLGALWGAHNQIRLTHDTTAAKPMASIVIETIRSWSQRTDGPPPRRDPATEKHAAGP